MPSCDLLHPLHCVSHFWRQHLHPSNKSQLDPVLLQQIPATLAPQPLSLQTLQSSGYSPMLTQLEQPRPSETHERFHLVGRAGEVVDGESVDCHCADIQLEADLERLMAALALALITGNALRDRRLTLRSDWNPSE